MDSTSGRKRESAAASTDREIHRDASQPPTVGRDRTALVDDSRRYSVPARGSLTPPVRSVM